MDTNLGQVVLVEDINPGISQGYNGPVRPIDFFMPDDSGAESSEELDSSADDESSSSMPTSPYPDSSFPSSLIEFNDKLYFAANDGNSGNELFVSDGTAEGTQLLVDLRPEENNYGYSYGSNPYNLVEFNDKLYFTANDGNSGNELFVSDGTAEGTQLLVDLYPGEDKYGFGYSSFPNNLVEFNDKLYFTADDGESGYELFVSDGTAEGTQLLVDLYPGEGNYGFSYGSDPSNLVEFNDKLYFTANNGENGSELFVSDGTAEGTQLLVDLYPGESKYGFSNSSYPSNLVEFNDKLYFTANNGESGAELFVTDGTAEGTQLLVDLYPGEDKYGFSYGSYPSNLVEFNDKLYFTANNGESGSELFVTDGTAEGTQLVADIRPGVSQYGYSYGSAPYELTVVGDELFFSANNGETGTELFKLTLDDSTGETPELINCSNGSDNLFGGEEVSATLDGINTEQLTSSSSDFETI